MEVPVRSRRSPERPKSKSLTKLQVVYYLSRNGLLEHPHSLELTLPPAQPLRLKHVLDRLMALRGTAMPSLYSWSCKRSYKGGYVWYDLGANDIIHPPTHAAECVLKGSRLLQASSERFQQLQLGDRQVMYQESNLNLKRKPFQASPRRETQEYQDYEDGDKTNNSSSTTTSHSRCSRGVSTDELEGHRETTKVVANHTSFTVSSTSNGSSKRFFNGGGSAASRSSVLLQLIACGSSAVAKAPCMSDMVKRKDSVEKVAVRKSAGKLSETEMIRYMSEKPRFGNSQSEEKEYFSGRIVESMKAHPVVLNKSNSGNSQSEEKEYFSGRIVESMKAHPVVLNKSNSDNGERRHDRVEEEEEEEEEEEKKREVKGKCIPCKKCSGSSKEIKK